MQLQTNYCYAKTRLKSPEQEKNHLSNILSQ